MKVKVTKTMAKELKKNFEGKEYQITFQKIPTDIYRINVSYDLIENEEDYNMEDNTFNIIKVNYPAEYYAMPRYLTSRDLRRAYRESDKTYDGFMRTVESLIEI